MMMIMSTRKRTVDSFHLCVFASALGKFEGKKEGGREGGNRWFSSFFRVSLKLFNFFLLLGCLNEEGRVFRDYSGALTSQAAPLKKNGYHYPVRLWQRTRHASRVMLCCVVVDRVRRRVAWKMIGLYIKYEAHYLCLVSFLLFYQ